jgi:hypothetical protein
VPADGRLDLIELVPTRANGGRRVPRLRRHGADGRRDGVAAVTGFPDAGLFARFGLPLDRRAAAVDFARSRS